MEVNKILGSDFLDLLFEGRNKSYGAYELRRNYKKRLQIALAITMAAILLIFIIAFISSKISDMDTSKVKVQEVTLTDIKQEEQVKVEPPPPPPPPAPEPPKIEITKFTPPKIVEDEKFEEEKEVKEQEEITNVGKIDQEGIKDPEIVNPPKVEEETKVVEAPVDDNQIFTKVEVEAQFPGGEAKWNDYVYKTIMRSIDDLVDDGQAGTVEVQFIVDKEGNVSSVEAMNMKGSVLARVATDAIKKGPKWVPAIQNGRQVRAWRRQKITFRLPDE
jgi:protein TonB